MKRLSDCHHVDRMIAQSARGCISDSVLDSGILCRLSELLLARICCDDSCKVRCEPFCGLTASGGTIPHGVVPLDEGVNQLEKSLRIFRPVFRVELRPFRKQISEGHGSEIPVLKRARNARLVTPDGSESWRSQGRPQLTQFLTRLSLPECLPGPDTPRAA